MLAVAILAGGEARRFGRRDKSALRFGATRLIERELAVLRQVTDHVLIVTNQPERYTALGVSTVADAIAGAGALGGLYTAVIASPASQTLVVACDMPFLSAPFLGYLAERGRDVDIAIPRTRSGYEPFCASYSRACADPIRRLLDAGHRKAADVVTLGLRVRELDSDDLAPFDSDTTLFANVNTARDYRRALAILDRRGE